MKQEKLLPVRSPLCAFLLMASAISGAQANSGEIAARQEFLKKLAVAAVERSHHSVRYDPAYVRIPYPGGDVPADTGVCTDEIIRAYRALGIDLQKEVHEDMAQNFSAYPRKWRWLSGHPDANIDHRRVPNLMVFFSRKGETLGITERAQDYSPGGPRNLGPRRKCAAHWNCRGSKIGREQPIHDSA